MRRGHLRLHRRATLITMMSAWFPRQRRFLGTVTGPMMLRSANTAGEEDARLHDRVGSTSPDSDLRHSHFAKPSHST